MEIYTEIQINASSERVWRLLTNFASFPQWNPFIRRASGNPEKGAQLEVYLQPEGAKGMTFRPLVLTAEPGRELRWLGHLLIPGCSTVSTFSSSSRLLLEVCDLYSVRSLLVCWFPFLRTGWILKHAGVLKI